MDMKPTPFQNRLRAGAKHNRELNRQLQRANRFQALVARLEVGSDRYSADPSPGEYADFWEEMGDPGDRG